MSALRLCSACRHQVVPVRPRPFARGVASAAATNAVNEHLDDEFGKRKIEEQRVAEGFPFDAEPRYFPWCSKLTVSKKEVDALLAKLLKGDDQAAREAEEAGRIAIDFANGQVLPIYVVCARANARGDCADFQAR